MVEPVLNSWPEGCWTVRGLVGLIVLIPTFCENKCSGHIKKKKIEKDANLSFMILFFIKLHVFNVAFNSYLVFVWNELRIRAKKLSAKIS